MFRDVVTSLDDLRAMLGTPSEIALKKEIRALDAHCRDIIAHAPFMVLGTSGADGRCDVSPKGDPAGFVRVLDDTHLAIPDRPGNKRLDGMRNLLHNPHVGLIFLIPGREDTLRVNGRACIVRDEEILAPLAVQGKRPKVAIGVEIEECFLHCAKAFKRSGLWDQSRWPDVAGLPSMAKILWEQIDLQATATCSVDEFEVDMENRLRKGLY